MIDIFSNTNILLTLAMLWVLPWKGYALWIAAKNNEKWWFIVILVINTLAILDIIYIFLIAKKRPFAKKDAGEVVEEALKEVSEETPDKQ